MSARGHGDPPAPGLVEQPVERVWIDGPGRRYRTEREDRLRVRVGDTWWLYDDRMGALSNEGEPAMGSGGHDLEELLDAAPLAGMVDIVLGEVVVVGGRSGRLVTATRRNLSDARASMMLHGPGGDFRWVVDDERGVLLRSEVHFDARPYQITELREVVFDAAFADDVFVFTPPPGEVVRSPSDQMARPVVGTIEEIAARAPFTVLVPERLPEGARIEARYLPGSDRPPRAPIVWLSVATDDRLHRFSLHQSTEPMPDGLDWQEEQGMEVYDGGQFLVKRELLGTHVRMEGDFDRATTLAIAASLRPAPTEPPPLTDAR